jgi:uncharacterized repeat protein (TIGR02543 family)
MKKLLYVLLAMTVAFAMVSCGGDDDPVVPTTPVPTVTGVTISGANYAQKGLTETFIATVQGANGPPQTVTWEVTGGVAGTSIDDDGVLTVDSAETATTLVITATSTYNPAVSSDDKSVGVLAQGGKVVESVTVTSPGNRVQPGATMQFAATVEGYNLTAANDKNVTWSLSGAEEVTTTLVNGLLTVAATETAVAVTVTATSTLDTDVYGIKNIGIGSGGPVADTPPAWAVNEVVALENGSQAVYKFEIPAGRTFEDYVAISAEYQLVNPANAAGEDQPGAIQIRAFRLYGNYLETDFITNDGGVDLNAYVAKFDDYNGAYIAQNLSGYNWNYAVTGIGTDPAAWFTREIPLEATYSNSGTVGANWPSPSYTGTLYLGIGISGVPGSPIVQRIKNVKLVVASDLAEFGVPNLYSPGSGFDDGLPAFASYAPFPKEAAPYRGAAVPAIIKLNWQGTGEKPRVYVVPKGTTAGDLELPTDDITGFFFQGWTYDSEGDEAVDDADTFDTDLVTLYAQWEPDPDYVPEPAAAHPFPDATTTTTFNLFPGSPAINQTWTGGNATQQKGWNTYDTAALEIGHFTWATQVVIKATNLNQLEFTWHNNKSGNGWVGGTKQFNSADPDVWLAGTDYVTVTEASGVYTATVTLGGGVLGRYADFIATSPSDGDWVGLLIQVDDWANVSSVELVIPPKE